MYQLTNFLNEISGIVTSKGYVYTIFQIFRIFKGLMTKG